MAHGQQGLFVRPAYIPKNHWHIFERIMWFLENNVLNNSITLLPVLGNLPPRPWEFGDLRNVPINLKGY